MNQLYLALEAAPTVQSSDHAPKPNDAALIQNAQAGDAEALDCLLCKYRPDFRRHAEVACGGDHSAAEDVCQEACIKVIQCLPRFVAGRNFRRWVFGIINNQARHWKRNSKKVCT